MTPRRWSRGDVCMVERVGAGSGPRKIACIVMSADDPYTRIVGEKADGPVAKLCAVYPTVLQNEFWCGLQELVTAPANMPASHVAEVAPHIIARGGWVATGLAAEICAEALGRPQTLALCACDDGLPAASADDIDRIRRAFDDAAAGPDDLGARQARQWLDLIDASNRSVGRGAVIHLDAPPAPVRPAEPRSELSARAALLEWRRSGGAV